MTQSKARGKIAAESDADPAGRFGVAGAPIPATRAYRRPIQFVHASVKAWAWVLLNEHDRTCVTVNTYNGNLGRRVDWRQRSRDFDPEGSHRTVHGYRQVAVASCPVACPAERHHPLGTAYQARAPRRRP